MVPGLGSGQTAVLASTPDGLRGPVVDDGIKVNGQVSVGFVFVSGMPAPAIGQPIDSTGLEQPIAPIDVTAAAATGTLAVDLIDTGGIGGNAPLYLVTRDQATNQVLESRLLFPARATFASTTPLGTPLVVASTTVPTTTPVADGTLYYHQDGLGTVTELTDINGAVAKAYAYDAYGNILESPGTVEQPYTYTGREFDSESGLYYYRARYYDALTGRFLQKDPIGFGSGDSNFYRYVRNAPARFNDPRGLKPGDPFDSEREAVLDAIDCICAKPKSARRNEWGGYVRRVPTNQGLKYVASDPKTSNSPGSVEITAPRDESVTALYHTHNSYFGSLRFTDPDDYAGPRGWREQREFTNYLGGGSEDLNPGCRKVLKFVPGYGIIPVRQ